MWYKFGTPQKKHGPISHRDFFIFKAIVLLMQNSESSAKNILILVEFARAMEKELGEISQDAFVEYSLRVGEYRTEQILTFESLTGGLVCSTARGSRPSACTCA